ncbi:hypothetical protein CRG98_010185 [Punica granatum]|uniref:Uncharacterized protein n=1 Tax=Punica granatum TaxID=22663 RepID=A0A2I0KLK7_PUNGR|nr:hypothetical protein CRG98_010185 [Punica granatum]
MTLEATSGHVLIDQKPVLSFLAVANELDKLSRIFHFSPIHGTEGLGNKSTTLTPLPWSPTSSAGVGDHQGRVKVANRWPQPSN